jgi:hypothetical protein
MEIAFFAQKTQVLGINDTDSFKSRIALGYTTPNGEGGQKYEKRTNE